MSIKSYATTVFLTSNLYADQPHPYTSI